MAIEITSGLVHVVRGVREYFVTNHVSANVVLGWSGGAKQSNQGPGGANRVVFQPSDETGKAGRLASPKDPGPRILKNESGAKIGSVRSLRSWERQVIVTVWAVDPSRPQDEEATIEATEALFEWTLRAVHVVAQAAATWGDVSYTTSPAGLTYGREIRVPLTLNQPLYDRPLEMAFPTLGEIEKKLDEE